MKTLDEAEVIIVKLNESSTWAVGAELFRRVQSDYVGAETDMKPGKQHLGEKTHMTPGKQHLMIKRHISCWKRSKIWMNSQLKCVVFWQLGLLEAFTSFDVWSEKSKSVSFVRTANMALCLRPGHVQPRMCDSKCWFESDSSSEQCDDPRFNFLVYNRVQSIVNPLVN